jgi:hypothetical protein
MGNGLAGNISTDSWAPSGCCPAIISGIRNANRANWTIIKAFAVTPAFPNSARVSMIFASFPKPRDPETGYQQHRLTGIQFNQK